MSATRGQPSKLTIDDLDRFLSLPARDEGITPYCEAAAVLASFDPLALQPVGGSVDARARADVLPRLRPMCEVLTESAPTSSWTLTLPERRASLKRLATRERMKAALNVNQRRPEGALQRAFERVLEPGPITLDDLLRDDLAALLTVHGWVDGVLDGVPDPAAILKALRRTDLLAPMHRLTSSGFVGRDDEMQKLAAFVFGPQPIAPLFVFGPGGVGKSTLMARFILTQVESRDLPIAYLDIDRPTIRPDHPPTLLLEAIAQLQHQLEAPTGQVESVAKELEYALRRHEDGRQLESAAPEDWTTQLFANNLTQWLKGRTALVVIDTVEEAQFLGSDVMGPFVEFVCQIQRLVPGGRVVLSGRTLPDEYLWEAFPAIMQAPRLPDSGPPLDLIPEPHRPVNVDVLDPPSARELLQSSLEAAGVPRLNDDNLEDVIRIVSRNPMCLKLAARLVRDEGVAALREDRTKLLTRLRAEKIQALLYGRILRHLHGDDVKKVAYPGLIVRRIDADVIAKVLAGPCEIELGPERNEFTILSDLAKEAALVETDPADGSLRHRPDVRRAMLEDLTDHVDASVMEAIDRNAVEHYETLPGDIARGEEIYHRLRLKQPLEEIAPRWTDGAGQRLKGALDEFQPQQRLWLAERLSVTLDPLVRQSANQEAWEAQTARSADRYLQSRSPDAALKVLQERTERLPRSALFAIESEAYRFLGKPDEALAVARRGVDSATGAGAIDMALELLLRMVVIEEGREHLAAAETLLKEAAAVASHSANRLLKFRVTITMLRLQRQLRPGSRAERAQLRREAMDVLDEEMLRKVQQQPVLLREVAAELAKQDPRVASAAIETLGIEVGSDKQAQAFGKAVASASEWMNISSGSALISGLDQIKQSNFDPGTIRKWATQALTSRDTRRLGSALAGVEAGDKILSGFRDYFRAGVASTLSVDKF